MNSALNGSHLAFKTVATLAGGTGANNEDVVLPAHRIEGLQVRHGFSRLANEARRFPFERPLRIEPQAWKRFPTLRINTGIAARADGIADAHMHPVSEGQMPQVRPVDVEATGSVNSAGS